MKLYKHFALVAIGFVGGLASSNLFTFEENRHVIERAHERSEESTPGCVANSVEIKLPEVINASAAPESPPSDALPKDWKEKLHDADVRQNRLYASMIADPQKRRALKILNKRALSEQYSVFLKNAKLTRDQHDQILDSLAENLLEISEASAIATEEYPSLSGEALDAIKNGLYQPLQLELERKIASLAGDSVLKLYKSNKDHPREWASLDKLSSRLSQAGLALSDEQITKTIESLVSKKTRITSQSAQISLQEILDAKQLTAYQALLVEESLLKEGQALDDQLKKVYRDTMGGK